MTAKTKRRIKGSISLMLVVVMIPLMVLSAFIVDTSRYNMAKSIISSSGDLALNSALADYDSVLKEVYGLFATSQSQANWSDKIKKYFTDSLSEYGTSSSGTGENGFVEALLEDFSDYFMDEGKDSKDFINISVDSFKAEGHPESALSNPKVLKKQIVEFMKYRAPANFAMSFFDTLSSFGRVGDQMDIIQKQIATTEATANINKNSSDLYSKILDYDSYAAGDKFKEPAGLKPVDYRQRILDYRSKYEANYEDIHYYYLGFQVVSYITDLNSTGVKNLNELKKYISSDKIINKSGLDYYIESPNTINNTSSYSTALANLEDDLKKLDVEKYVSTAKNYLSGKYMDVDYLNGDKFKDRDKAFNDYQQFNKFLYDEETAKYSTVKEILKLADKTCGDFNALKRLYEKAQNDSINNLDKANQKVEELEDKLNAAKDDLSQAEYDLLTAEEAYDEAVAAGDDAAAAAAYKAHEKAGKARETALKDVAKAEENLEAAKKNAEKSETDLKDIEEKYNEKAQEYNAVMEKFYDFSQRFAKDAATFIKYKDTSATLIEPMVQKISTEFQQIINNLKVLSAKSKQISNQCLKVFSAIDDYQNKLEDWELSNENYKDNGVDNFSRTNDADIGDYKSSYSKDSFASLASRAAFVANEIDLFVDFLESDTGTLYGIASINRIEDLLDLKASVSKSSYYKNNIADKKFITQKELNDAFSELYTLKEENMPEFDLRTYTTEAPLHPCVYYLMDLHGSQNGSGQTDLGDGSVSDSEIEKLLEEAVDNGNSASKDSDSDTDSKGSDTDSKGSDTEGDKSSKPDKNKEPKQSDCDKYGYHYGGESIPISNKWPSGASTGDYSPTDSLVFSMSGDGAMSSSFAKQVQTLKSTLSGISKLEGTRDNIYLLQYIFENFSYNTLVQDLKRKAEGNDAISIAGGDYSKYIDAATTSTGVTMNYLNNAFYGAEIEYILYGKSKASANVEKFKDTLFLIRLGFNLIFTFTDNDVRTYAKKIGMAVQAASYGYIPYWIPMTLVQLLLGFFESKLDMKLFDYGAKVAVVKTSDTFLLNPKNGFSTIFNIAKSSVIAMAKNYAKQMVESACNKAISGVQNFIDGQFNNLKEGATDLISSLEKATNSKVNEVVNTAYAQLESNVNQCLNDLLFEPYNSIDEAKTKVTNAFKKIKLKLQNDLKFDDTIGKATSEFIRSNAISNLETLEKSFIKQIESIPRPNDIGSYILSGVKSVKSSFLKMCNSQVSEVAKMAKEELGGAIDSVKEEIMDLANSEMEDAKKKITQVANSYIDTMFNDIGDYFDTGSFNSTLGGDSNDGSVKLSSVFSLSYSDYLKIFLFIDLCGDESTQLRRVADLIQLNISTACSKSDLYHDCGSTFSMLDAYTYVTIKSEINFPMMFLNMDLFSKQIDAYNDDIEDMNQNGANLSEIDLVNSNKILYQSIAGY